MTKPSAALFAVLAVAASVSADDRAAPKVVEIPSAVDVVAPPRVAAGADGRAFVALPVAGGVDVVVADRDGAEFGAPIHAVRRDDLICGGRRGPRIAVAGKAVLVAAITRREKRTGGDLLAWRSSDGGATWSEAVRVGDVPGCSAEGLFDLAALGDGRFAVVWLDVRRKGTRLVADFSADGAAWGEDVVAYVSPGGSICECCAPAIAPADGGAIVAFRNSEGGDRDVWTTRLASGARTFAPAAKCGQGAWKLAGCPMAGPAVAVTGADVVSAWRREDHVFVAAGDAPERDLGEGTEPQVAVLPDGVHVVWTLKDALLHLAPRASAPETIAKSASFPCAAGRAVVWLDTSSRRARLAILR